MLRIKVDADEQGALCSLSFGARYSRMAMGSANIRNWQTSGRSSFVKYVFGPAFVIGLLALSPSGRAAGDRVPDLHIESSCREAQSSIGLAPEQTYKNCLADEREAREKLVQKWSQFKPVTRRNCIEAGAAPNPSYVELLTCLEMFNEILMPPAADTVPARK